MLLQQLASIFLCSQFPSSSDVQHTLGLHCTQEGCREFLKCHAPSNVTCSCFLQKGMKAFSCPRKYFVVSESGTSDLPEATRFYCKFFSMHVNEHLSPHLTSAIIIGKLDVNEMCLISFDNGDCDVSMNIFFGPKNQFTIDGGKDGYLVAKRFPFKGGRKFEMKLLFRQNEYEVRVDGEMIFSVTPSPECYTEHLVRLILVYFGEIQSLHFSYNK